MARRPVFLSFYYEEDVFRLHQIKNMGAIERQPILSANDFEEIRLKGPTAVKKWIDDNMRYKRCLIVLIGRNTSSRPWVQYEIKKAWDDKKSMFGIYIHNLECPKSGYCAKGANPFDVLGSKISGRIDCYDPNLYSFDSLFDPDLTKGKIVYKEISKNLESWIENAIEKRNMIDMFGI